MHHLWAEALAPLYAVGDIAKKDSSGNVTARVSKRHVRSMRLRADAVSTRFFDMNGVYMGTNANVLPRGRYIVRQKMQGRFVNKVYVKK